MTSNDQVTERPVQVSAQVTPNPNTLKFMVDRVFFERGSFDFATEEAAKSSGLALALFELEDVTGVFVGVNFVSVTKREDSAWPDLVEPTIETIKGYLDSGEAVIDQALLEKGTEHAPGDSDIIRRIKEILDQEIRPAVAMDGGDVVFHDYTDGVLTLHLQGACSSCPSSVFTLKMGIENRLKEEIPELKEVISS